ncbi:MAG: transglutaminase-like domain-containing protein [Mariniblastus sp.]|nr:transglutaminase-like domain-containing protein [Mariniblastus sp.]
MNLFNRKFAEVLITCFVALCLTPSPSASAQTASSTDTDYESATKISNQLNSETVGIKFSEPQEHLWEFGVKVNSTGSGRLITVSGPLPMEWPEQEIEITREDKTENVGALKQKNATKHARQFSFGVNRLGPGESATGILKVKVKKRFIIAPSDTSQYIAAKKVPTPLKTFLKPSPFIESKHKRIRDIAQSLEDDSLSSWDQVKKIYEWVRANVEYKFDKKNYSCLHALDNKMGDCGELSALFIAICRAQGIPARSVWIPGHTYPEFYLEDKQGNGHWFPCQAAGDYQFGSMAEPKPILHKGDRFKIPGQREEVRYLRPTLTAREGQGLSIEWIAREIANSTK